MHKYTNTQIHKYSNTQILKYTNTQIHKYINSQVSHGSRRVFPGGGDLMCHHMVQLATTCGQNMWNKEMEFLSKMGLSGFEKQASVVFLYFSKTSWWSPNEQTEATICGLPPFPRTTSASGCQAQQRPVFVSKRGIFAQDVESPLATGYQNGIQWNKWNTSAWKVGERTNAKLSNCRDYNSVFACFMLHEFRLWRHIMKTYN